VLVAPGTDTASETRFLDLGGPIVEITSCAILADGVTLISESGPTVTTIGPRPESCGKAKMA